MVSIEVGKLKSNLSSSDWNLTDKTLMGFYSFPSEVGIRGRQAILEALEEISSRTRDKIPKDTVYTIGSLVTYIIPTKGKGETVNMQEWNLYQLGMATGFNIAYDGIKYLDNGKHAKLGLEIIFRLARYSRFNKRVMSTAFREMDRLLDISKSYKKMNKLIVIYKKAIETKEMMYPILPNEYNDFY
jgi:hypothetical protein